MPGNAPVRARAGPPTCPPARSPGHLLVLLAEYPPADNRRLEFVRSLFGQFCADENDVEVRSMLAFSAVIGSYFVTAEHGDMTRSQVL